MSVAERLMGIGSWKVSLREDCPFSILKQIDLDATMFGHIIITPTRIDPSNIDPLTVSRYTGIVRAQPDSHTLAGPGLAAWLADEEGKGAIWEGAITRTAGTFAQWLGDIRPNSLAAGTAYAVAGTLTHTIAPFSNRRQGLDFISDYFGTEWKITPQGALEAGYQASLFVTTPTAVVTRRSTGNETGPVGLPATRLQVAKDAEDYGTRVVVLDAQDRGLNAANAAITPPKNLFGNTVSIIRIVTAPDATPANAAAVATMQAGRFDDINRTMTLGTDLYDIGSKVDVGDNLYVFDPANGLSDFANQLEFRGETIFPKIIRVHGYTWPVRRGMGVYLRMPTTAGTIVDLSEWVDFEDGLTSVDVGSTPRSSSSNAQTVKSGLNRTIAGIHSDSMNASDESGSASFGATFLAAPAITASVKVGSNADLILNVVTVTTTGFTYRVVNRTASVVNVSYEVHWHATGVIA
jgi:hypothetical protein